MGNKIGVDWTIESITPEGARELLASAGNILIARAAFEAAVPTRPGRVVRLMHGPRILESRKDGVPERER